MSTATGPAYKIVDGTNFFSIGEQLIPVIEAQELGYTQRLYNYLVSQFDEFERDKQTAPLSFEEFVVSTTNSFLEDFSERKDKVSDFSELRGKLAPKLVFYHNPVRDEVYVRLIDFTDKAVETFAALPFVEKNMEYYNGTDDQLNHMTEEEWHDLRDAWEEASTRNKPVSSTVKIDLFDTTYKIYHLTSLKNLRKRWEQLEHIVTNDRLSSVFHSYYTDFYMKTRTVDSKTFPWSILFDIRRYDFETNNVHVLPDGEENVNIINQLRQESVSWVETHPVTL